MAAEVFISYSRRDQEFVLRLAIDLEERGAQVWIDQGDLQGGEQWRRAISEGIQRCQVLLLVVSPDAIKSPYVAEEVDQALELGKPVIPLFYRRARIPEPLTSQLSRFQFLDFQRGGYAQNRADLVTALAGQGVQLRDAGELTPAEMAERRRQRLGEPVKTRWGVVFARMPGWALAWGLGWGLFWLLLPILLLILGNESIDNLTAPPIGGFVGGLAGGLLAGLCTMFALRRHAISITWKHMALSIRIWGVVGPLGAIVAGGLAFLFFTPTTATGPDCSGLSFGDCIGAILGQSIASALGNALGLIFLIILCVLIAVFAIGAVAGWLAVRAIRRLEPGILGRQAIWVVIGWGGGAVLAALVALAVIGTLQGG